jgi:hypothetical protein
LFNGTNCYDCDIRKKKIMGEIILSNIVKKLDYGGNYVEKLDFGEGGM